MKNFEVKYNNEGCTNSIVIEANNLKRSNENNCLLLVDGVKIKFPCWSCIVEINEITKEEANEIVDFD